MDIKPIVNQYKNYVIELRREFHKYPEKSLEEVRTSMRVKEELDKLGIPYVSAANTGVVATIKGKYEGKTIALRADMDALSVNEENDIDYKSINEGMMHACGHDGHISMLLGAAKVLKDIEEDINGTVKLFFQPGEEVAKGAKAMIEDGVLEGVDSVFGIHLWSDLDVGKISVEEGPRMASSDIFKINVTGKGGHGSAPHQGIDAAIVASAIVMNLQSIVSRETSPLEPVVVSIGSIHSGTRFNVIASEAVLDGSPRCFNDEIRRNMPVMIERIAKNTAQAYRAEAELDYTWGMPAVINNKQCSELAKSTVLKLYGEDGLSLMEKLTGGEDMSEYMNIVPGLLAFVGCKNEDKGASYPHHHGKFKIDEDSLEIGTSLYVQYALDYLNSDI
ncbi:MAG: M20 family metallopeptidase [Peptostreptococcaceae bacterium]